MAKKPPETTVQRLFLGWDEPILHAARDFFFDRYLKGNLWDMDRVLVVVPSSYAGRRLGELMAEEANQQAWILRPPEIVTVGELPERLYQARFPFASDLMQVLAWTKALRSQPTNELQPLLVEPPSSDDYQPWLELARLLAGLHRELSSDLLLFSDVVPMLDGNPEQVRWKVLQRLQRLYLDELDKVRLWDIQTARRVAIEKGEPNFDQDIVVLGAVDLNRAQRRFLDAVASRVTILVGAPSAWKAGFDEHGALQASFWQDVQVQFDPGILHVRTTAAEAAREVGRQIARLSEPATPRDITLGVPDPSLIPLLRDSLDRIGVVARHGPGTPTDLATPIRVLDLASQYVSDGAYSNLAGLVRQPAVSAMLRRKFDLPDDFLQQLDQYYSITLLKSVNVPEWPVALGLECVQRLVEAIDKWLVPLRSTARPLGDWTEPLLQVLRDVFAETVVDLDNADQAGLWGACSQTCAAIDALDEIPDTLQIPATVAEAVAWIRRLLEKSLVPPPPQTNAIEMLGWLELALDDAPALILTGIHDNSVPESVNADAFLPNELRKRLGLIDNARRYARDCYVMQTILHARDHVAIVLNRLSVQGDPQIPSRLLLALPPEQLGARVDWLLDSKEPENLPSVQSRWPVRQGQSEIPIPLPDPNLGVSAMAVTDFKLYQECPYRFYLARVCRLKPMDDDRLELRADGFGNLIHDVVDGLKGSPVATSIDADQVAKWLLARLDNVARKRFGVVRSPALMIQIEQARARLKAFAILQAKRAAEGWDIIETEVKIPIEAGIRIGSMPLHGRIDRIDFHESSGRWAILDYKTSDMVADPKRHFDTDLGPVDFQLPLYRHLVRGLNRPIQGPIELGYIALSKSIGEIKIAMAEFSDEQLAQSDRRAREIADLVERRVFWPPKMNDLKVWDNFQAICQNSVAKRWVPPPDGLPQSLVSSELPKSTQSEAGPSRKARPSAPHFDPEHPLFRGSCRVPRQNRKVDDRPVRLALKPLKAAGTPPDDWFNPLLIRASAGTGKTFQLANRMLRLLFADQPPDHVLATTFTRKAAGEILERVLLRLAKATIDDQWLTQLQRELQPLKIQREHCQYQLARLCANLHRFRVSTLDSFYSQLAKSFSLELQLPPGWRLADPYAETQLRDLAIQRLFEAQDHDQLKTLLSMLFKGELDRSIQSQIREVVKNGYGLFRVTQAEAWTPIAAPKSPSSADVDRAFQELQAVPVENQKWKGAVQTLGRLIAAQDWEAILKQTLVQAIVPDDETQVPTYNRVQLTWPAIQSVNTIAQAAMSRELGLRREQSEATYQLLAAYDQQLNLVKRSTRTLTFDDIAFRLSQWFQATQSRDSSGDPPVALNVSPKGRQTQLARVSWRMDSRVDHLLLDEFQDTSPVQWEIVKPFAEAIAREGLRRDRSFFCVGDTKQAIYGWRGGVAEIFESVGSQLPHVQDRPLVTSYRSSPVITEFVNEVFRNLDRHPSKQYGIGHAVADAWQRDFPEHQTARSESGYVQFCNGPEKKRANRNEEEIEDSDETLLGWMAEEIESLARRAPHISIGVLARTNKDVANLIGFLRDRQLDASQEGGNPLTDSAAVELVLSLFHMADHPGDSVCAFHVQHSPLAHVLGMDAGRTGDTIAESIRTQVHLQGYGLAVSSFVNRLAPFCNQRDQIRLEQLISVAFRFEELREKRIRDFVRFVREQRLTLPNPSQIRVMTIHQSKGLEFDAVFLSVDQAIMGPPPTLVARQESPTSNPTGVLRYINKDIQRFLDQEWQDVFRSQAQRQLSESLSVFYVAMTRARRGLYLYGVPQKNPVMRWGSALHSILRVSEEQRVMTKCQLVSRGDPLWYQPASSPEQPPNHPEATQRLPESIQSSDEKEAPAAQTISIQLASVDPLHVSRLRPTRRPSSADQPRIVPLRNALADNESMGAIVGTLIHRWFEEIQWIEDFEFQPAAMRELALATLTPDQMPHVSLDYWLEQMEQLLQLDSVRLALARQRYAEWSSQGITRIEVHNERRLLEIMDGTLLRGTIDRLVVGYCGHRPARAEIMDFKTDARNPSLDLTAWELDRAEHHRPQLELYRRIICQQLYLPSECVQLSLLLLSGDRLVSIACEDLNPMNAVNS